MAVNKVVYNTANGEEVLMDLTEDTVTPNTLAKGATAHDASGNVITGTMRTVDELLEDVTVNDTLFWDGNTEGKAVFDMMGDGTYTYYPVSENVITLDDLANGLILESSDLDGNVYEEIKLTDFAKMSNKIIASRSVSSVLFVLEDNAPLYAGTIPKKGIYFLKSNEFGYASKIQIPGYTGFDSEIEVLKEKYLPTHSHTWDDITDNTAVLYTEQTLTEAQKAQARVNIDAASAAAIADKADKTGWTANKYIGTDASGNLVTKDAPTGGSGTPIFVNSKDEMTDTTKLYVLDGYIYQYGTYTEEVVIPGETVTVPAKAVIIKGYRYSQSSGAFQTESDVASVIFPIEVTETTTSTNTVDLVLTNMLGHKTRTGIYYGDTNISFPGTAIRVALGSLSEFDVYGVPIGKKFVNFNIQYTGTETFANASFRYDTTTFTSGNIEVYSDPTYATIAAFGSTTTTEGTTETITVTGFYNTGYKYQQTNVVKHNKYSIIMDDSVQALDSSVSMTIPQLKKNKTISFSGVYTGNLAELSIVQGEGSGFTECKCVVTATNITILKNSAEVYTAAHGLTFGSYFSIVLMTKNLNKTKAYLSSGGNTFTSAEFVWDTAKSGLKLYTNVPFATYNFTFGSSEYDKKLWIYGDSYLGHWMPHSINRGATNYLADGYSGGGSSAGLASFRLSLEHATPAKVVWCLGMNNGDKGTINQSWLDSITAVKEICEENEIELWVATIPNVPNVDNTYKNAYIRENFDNVIDFSKLVGADESTSWYTGLLSSDNVHPSSTAGDFYFASIMESYFPEIMDA